MPYLHDLLKIAMGESSEAPQAIDAIASHRRSLARALLMPTDRADDLKHKVPPILLLAANAFPWDPTQEDYELSQAILSRWQPGNPEVHLLLAAFALAPAYHFQNIVPLKSIPEWIRPHYARYLLTAPPLFHYPGEADRYAAHCTEAMRMLKISIIDDELPDAVNLAQTVLGVSSSMLYFNEQSLRDFFSCKSAIIEWLLLKTGHKIGFPFPESTSSKPKIGILLHSIFPGTETFYALAHLKGLDRAALDITLYLTEGRPTILSDIFRASTDRIVALPQDLKAAVETIRRDQLDICLIAVNVTWGVSPQTLLAAHRLARVQVIGAASPVTTGLSSADFFLSGMSNDDIDAASEYQEQLVRLPGAVTYYAFSDDPESATMICSRESLGLGEEEIVFFSAANYYKITPELLITWCEILARVPNSRLLLMPFNPNWNNTYPVALFLRRMTRQMLRAGIRSDRVRTINKVPTRADLLRVMALADIYLDSFPFSGACSLIDPLMLGLPIVARCGKTFRSNVASSVLQMDHLNEAITRDADSYIERAVRLAEQSRLSKRRNEGTRGSTVPASLITEPYAKKFEHFCVSTAQKIKQRENEIAEMTATGLNDEIKKAIRLLLVSPSVRFQQMTDLDIATDLLMSFVSRCKSGKPQRIVDVGACTGEFSKPFLQAGFYVDMFEPDPDCTKILHELTLQFATRARHHAIAVTGQTASSVTFHKRSVGLSGLGPVDECAHPQADGGDVHEAEVALRGFVVSCREAA